MITIKNDHEIALMREAGRISKNALIAGGHAIHAGATTAEVNAVVERYITSHGATPSFKGYQGFPAGACISINDEVIHGIPGHRKIEPGDVVSLDVGAFYKGFHGDNAATFLVDGGREEDAEANRRLIAVTRQSFYEGLKFCRVGYRISDISHAVQEYVEKNGFSVVRPFVGHGIGHDMHEDPEVPNYGRPGHGPRLEPGMTICVEPMVNMGTHHIRQLSDGWTVITEDGLPAAHYENTILITEGEPELLTVGDEEL